MNEMAFLEKIGWRYWVIGIIMGIALPGLATLVGISPVWRFGGLLVIINGCLAIAIGRAIYRRTQPGWWLLIWPIIYLLGALWFLPRYTRYFAIVYLCVSYLAYGLTQTRKEVKS
ncbi:hypothetical protein FD13_GL001834 [Levilactobacillus senmaizukei DSM 21775 = NBRC 103853]|uniref:Integral membrane protein n=2 Tax=Levilactobacillus senmaizukei TaxID=431273 RepID=A0A0R2DF60_9LACO|nr:hypothetical protein FD13_GL001834 [Levilactobacillus senmaizukei DSM 21775 = NBRC 103853]